MRGRLRQKQSIWISTVTEKNNGMDKTLVYSNPQKKNISVSATAGTPEELSAGIVPDYDRYITVFDRTFQPKESNVLWIDVVPEIRERRIPRFHNLPVPSSLVLGTFLI